MFGDMNNLNNAFKNMFDPQKFLDMSPYKDMFQNDLVKSWQNAYQDAAQKLQQNFGQGLGQNFTQNFGQNFKDAFNMPQGATIPGTQFDAASIMTAQKKNVEALTAANQAAFNGMQQVLRCQADIFRDTMQSAAQLMNDLMATGTAEEKLARQADIAQKSFDLASKNIKELADLVAQSQQDAINLVSARVAEGLSELKATAEKAKASASGSSKAAS